MRTNVYTFSLDLDWALLKQLSQIDRFDASWSSLEKIEGDQLKQLKMISTVQSVGSSTRIEGSSLMNTEVEQILLNIKETKLNERDEQEVAGYFQTLDIICEAYESIDVNENAIRHLHSIMLSHSFVDVWHKGAYKQHTNAVEATYEDGSKQIIFKTTEPGFATEGAMRNLVDWYFLEDEIHPLIKCAIFVYEFLSIHPFQDGNGRLSRLMTSLLLLKHGYVWIQYISFEHEIENRKSEYYRVLRHCQSNRPNEAIDAWIKFFLNCLSTMHVKLGKKLKSKRYGASLTPKETLILQVLEAYPGLSSGVIADKINVPLSTVKRHISALVEKQLLIKHGRGAGTNYELAQD